MATIDIDTESPHAVYFLQVMFLLGLSTSWFVCASKLTAYGGLLSVYNGAVSFALQTLNINTN